MNAGEKFNVHIPFAMWTCNRVCKAYGLPFDEFENAALIGLWEACKRHEASNGALTTYATYWIRGGILNQLRETRRLPKMPRAEPTWQQPSEEGELRKRVRWILNRREEYAVIQWIFEGKSLKSIGERLNISKERVRQLISRALLKLRNALSECDWFDSGSRHIPARRRLPRNEDAVFENVVRSYEDER